MGTTTFSGPVKAGSVRDGASANVGFVVMAQTAAWTQSTTAADTGIVIPAGSQVLDFEVQIATACDGASQNLSVGTSATSNEFFLAQPQIPYSLALLGRLQTWTLGQTLAQLMQAFMLTLVLVLLALAGLPFLTSKLLIWPDNETGNKRS